ncbi:hypothetical protein Tco_0679358 [Tanacetum coccineum]|uniref:Uncharacterized protein n=1 Tax=Tanacetum coccineum TaxID=301880 RepID=A0ABQ4XHL6_9ASTR
MLSPASHPHSYSVSSGKVQRVASDDLRDTLSVIFGLSELKGKVLRYHHRSLSADDNQIEGLLFREVARSLKLVKQIVNPRERITILDGQLVQFTIVYAYAKRSILLLDKQNWRSPWCSRIGRLCYGVAPGIKSLRYLLVVWRNLTGLYHCIISQTTVLIEPLVVVTGKVQTCSFGLPFGVVDDQQIHICCKEGANSALLLLHPRCGKDNGENYYEVHYRRSISYGNGLSVVTGGNESGSSNKGIPKDIYSLINHYTDAKDIWENMKMILEGSELTKDDRESQLYDEFEHFQSNQRKENIHGYYVRKYPTNHPNLINPTTRNHLLAGQLSTGLWKFSNRKLVKGLSNSTCPPHTFDGKVVVQDVRDDYNAINQGGHFRETMQEGNGVVGM